MKKNAMLKIAAVLLVAVLLTTCAISSTFAKYVSSYQSTAETARVAKWGLSVDTTSIGTQKLFFSEYNDGEGVGSTGAMIMAPGTGGKIELSSLVDGTAEVSAQVKFEVKYTKNGFTLNDNYMPVTVKVNNHEISVSDSWQTIGAAIPVDANETIEADATDFTIEWNWAFDGNDDFDTDLGEDTGSNTITIQYRVVIEQTEDVAKAAAKAAA